jgi:hypothetical protein
MSPVLSAPWRCRAFGLILASTALAGCDRYHALPQCGVLLQGEPARRWVLGADGTAVQGSTGLTWYRCNAGERFVGDACVGEPARMAHAEAVQYAQDFANASGRAWRVPTVAEMQGLRLRECNNPAVDTRVFPSVRADHYWSGQEGRRGFGMACSVYTYNVMAQCRDDPQQKRLFWLVLGP